MLYEPNVDPEARGVFDTPWGRRELSNQEAGDLVHQGLTLKLADGDAEVSLESEKAQLSTISLTGTPAPSGDEPAAPPVPTQPRPRNS